MSRRSVVSVIVGVTAVLASSLYLVRELSGGGVQFIAPLIAYPAAIGGGVLGGYGVVGDAGPRRRAIGGWVGGLLGGIGPVAASAAVTPGSFGPLLGSLLPAVAVASVVGVGIFEAGIRLVARLR